ncbi:MAG: ROK family protein [Fimbriimonas sp.]
MADRACVIGVDLGGTNVRAGAFYEDGSEAGPSYSNPSHAQDGTEAILDALAYTILQAARTSETPPQAVGLAIPGHIDDQAGVVRWAPNFGEEVDGVFHYWEGVEIKAPLVKRTGIKMVMGNDANLAALGEYRFGTGRNSAKCLVMLTLGTGIGGGVVMASQSLQGQARGPLVLVGGNMGGAELGHTVINHNGPDCNSGEYGSIESYCGRDAIIQRGQNRLRRGRTSLLMEMLGGDIAKLTPRHLAEAAAKGDEVSLEVWAEVGTMLGVGIGNMINVFAPDIVAIGGQIAKAGVPLLGPAIREARNVAIPSLWVDAKVVIAEQIEDAGMLGGAALALEAL